MRSSSRWILLICLPMLIALRDPFRPPEDRCASAGLTQWHFHGVVGPLALMRGADNKWRRVAVGDPFLPGERVLTITPDAVTLALSAGCEPATWRWQREGVKKDVMDQTVGTAVTPERAGENAAPLTDLR